MASIEERKVKAGTSFIIKYYHDGKTRKIFLDSTYTKRDAENARRAVEGFITAKKRGEPLDRLTAEYFANAPADLLRRFDSLGINAARSRLPVATIWQEFRRYQEGTVKEATILHREIVFKRFAAHFDEAVRFEELTPVAVQEFRDKLVKLYAPTTVAKSIKDLRTFSEWAIRRGYAQENPFKSVPVGKTSNRARDYQVPAEWTARILDACPSQCWRTLYCLWRHAGLRQQEPMYLQRDSVDLDNKRLRVYATKTERYANGGFRVVPIVPVLAQELARHLQNMPQAEEYLIYENRRKSFHSGFQSILITAGLKRWEKPIQNLRSSCENDWVAQGIPAHVVAEWLGHSVKTQATYYLRVLPEYFDRVISEK